MVHSSVDCLSSVFGLPLAAVIGGTAVNGGAVAAHQHEIV